MSWPNLKYDTRLGGYRVGITEDQLKGAPKFNKSTDWNWSDRAAGIRLLRRASLVLIDRLTGAFELQDVAACGEIIVAGGRKPVHMQT
jgi:hypothetical protein